VMAIKAGAAIVPVSISGSRRLMRKGDWRIFSGPVRLRFHDPVPTEGCTLSDRARIMAQVREAILSGLEQDERPAASRAEQTRSTSGNNAPRSA
jgi:1-acyl-sn-glycerol-3-phosphate acyltransferase